MSLVVPMYRDVLTPVLFSSPAFAVTNEQKDYIREILRLTSSDSLSADKAYRAINRVLVGGSVVTPVVSSINPTEATLGDPSFTLHVIGTGFDSLAKIIWNGSVEPTVFVSATELTTVVDMSTAQVAIPIPVAVQNSNGVISNSVTFQLKMPVVPLVRGAESVVKKEVHKEVEKK